MDCMEIVIQLILIISIVALTIIFVTVGIWVILILREIRKAVDKVGKVGDDIKETTSLVKAKIKESINTVALLAAMGRFWSKKKGVGEFLTDLGEEIKKPGQKKKVQIKEEKEAEKKPKPSDSKKRLFFRKKNS